MISIKSHRLRDQVLKILDCPVLPLWSLVTCAQASRATQLKLILAAGQLRAIFRNVYAAKTKKKVELGQLRALFKNLCAAGSRFRNFKAYSKICVLLGHNSGILLLPPKQGPVFFFLAS